MYVDRTASRTRDRPVSFFGRFARGLYSRQAWHRRSRTYPHHLAGGSFEWEKPSVWFGTLLSQVRTTGLGCVEWSWLVLGIATVLWRVLRSARLNIVVRCAWEQPTTGLIVWVYILRSDCAKVAAFVDSHLHSSISHPSETFLHFLRSKSTIDASCPLHTAKYPFLDH